MRRRYLILLGVSLGCNGVLGFLSQREGGDSIAESRAGAGVEVVRVVAPVIEVGTLSLESDLQADGVADSLSSSGLTEAEIRNLQIASINKRFDDSLWALRRITTPWVTADEFYEEAVERIKGLHEAEEFRRSELESLTDEEWYMADVEDALERGMLIHILFARFGGIDAGDITELQGIISAGAREASFAQLNPFEINTKETEQVMDMILKQREGEARDMVSSELFDNYAAEVAMMHFEDVWSIEDRFGSQLPPDQVAKIKTLLIPEDPLHWIVGYKGHSMMRLPDSILPQIEEIVGEEAFANLLDFMSPDLEISPALHLEIYEIEKTYQTEFAAILGPDSPIDVDTNDERVLELRERYHDLIESKLGPAMDAYLTGVDGKWLNSELPLEVD